MKIGKKKNAELIFDHGLLLSRKFFISDEEIVKKYKSKAKKMQKSPGPKNFLQKNRELIKISTPRSTVTRKMSPSSSKSKPTKNNHFVDIRTGGVNAKNTDRVGRVTSAVARRSRRVNSAFDTPAAIITPHMQVGVGSSTFTNYTFMSWRYSFLPHNDKGIKKTNLFRIQKLR